MDPIKMASEAAAAVDERELVSLLQEMVRLRSYSAGGEEGRIARFMERHLTAMGLTTELQEVEPGRFNCVGGWGGTGGGRSLMFNGHLDTNPAGEGWTKDPFAGEVDDAFIYGIGVSNMKAADAAYAAAVRAVMRAGIRPRGDVIVAYVVGELQGGVGTVHLLKQGVRADRFIVGEPTDLAALTLHAGSMEAELTTYYRKGLPYLDAAYMKVFPEPSTELTAFKSKEVDLIWDVTPDLFSQVATLSGAEGLAVPGGTFADVIMPSDKPPFNDNRVREALKFTVDRSLMLAAIHGGHGELAHDHPVSSAYQFHAPLPLRAPDIAKAKALLRDAGHGGGLAFKLFVANSPPIREKMAVVLKEMARPAGFNIDVEVLAYDRYLAQVWNKGVPYVAFYGTRPAADVILMKLYHPKEGLDEGRWAAANPDAIRMLEQARETVDAERRRRFYGEFQKLSRDQGPFVLPFFRNELSGKWAYVRDFRLNPANFELELDEVWLAADAPKKKV